LVALEWLPPGESEEVAAWRLRSGIPDRYGSRLFDILLLDALYPGHRFGLSLDQRPAGEETYVK
jgi:hypothetical protein